MGRNKESHRGASRTRVARIVDAGIRQDPRKAAYRSYFAYVRKEAETEAKHGPVRVIVKDGKPGMSTITDNISAILLHLGINGVSILEELPDRVRALDTLGELQKHIDTHPEHWMHDAFDPLHGHITDSARERTRPSLQRVKHPISQINPNHPPQDHYDEMDVDYSPPDNPMDFLRHSAEVGHNLITRNKTDENEAARLLAVRFAKETDV